MRCEEVSPDSGVRCGDETGQPHTMHRYGHGADLVVWYTEVPKGAPGNGLTKEDLRRKMEAARWSGDRRPLSVGLVRDALDFAGVHEDYAEQVHAYLAQRLLPTKAPSQANAEKTSVTAAERLGDLRSLQREVLLHLHENPATDFEIERDVAQRLGQDYATTTLRKRRTELAQMGLVADSGERRPSPTGGTAIVWEVTGSGRALVAQG